METFEDWWHKNQKFEYIEDGNWYHLSVGPFFEVGLHPDLDIAQHSREDFKKAFGVMWNHQQAKINTLIKALEFYGEKDSWSEAEDSPYCLSQIKYCDVTEEPNHEGYAGKLARETLKAYK